MSKKKKGAAAGAAVLTAAMLLFGISGEKAIEVDYSIITNESVCEMSVEMPEDISADIVSLYCNDSLVTKAVLPDGRLKSIPIIFSDLENLELKFYKLGKLCGTGRFKDKKLYVAFTDEEGGGNE